MLKSVDELCRSLGCYSHNRKLSVLMQGCKYGCLFPQAVVMVLESNGEKTSKMVLQLLKSLAASSIITVDQMRRVCCHLVFKCFTAWCYFTICLCLRLFLIHFFFSFTGLWKNLHGHCWNQHWCPSCVLHTGALCGYEPQYGSHWCKVKRSLSLSVSALALSDTHLHLTSEGRSSFCDLSLVQRPEEIRQRGGRGCRQTWKLLRRPFYCMCHKRKKLLFYWRIFQDSRVQYFSF